MLRRDFLAMAPVWAAAAEPDGMMVVDGRRQFVLGSYHLPRKADAWREVREAGFHVINTQARREELDRAAKEGLRAWVRVGSDTGKIRGLVSELAKHPALMFWETEDEPSYQYRKAGPRIAPSQMIAAYRAIKGVDGSRPVYVNHSPTNLVSTLREYNAGTDILGTDIYPVAPRGLREQYALWPDGMHGDFLNGSISQVGQYAAKLREIGGAQRGRFMVLQAFAWEALRKEGDRNPRMILYPSADELRFMCYQSVIQGATGILFWGLHTAPGESGFWESLKTVVQELRGMEKELSAPSRPVDMRIEYHDTGHSLDKGIEWIAKPSSAGTRILAVNADRWPVDATFRRVGFEKRVNLRPFGAVQFQYG